MRGQFPMGSPGQAAMPPSLAPQIADLGTMIDQFAQRKIALAKMAEQERVNREKDLYYRGRVAAQEKRNEQMAANEQTRMDTAAMREARMSPGAGPVVLHRGGKARMFNPRFDPGSSPEQPQETIDSALSGFGRIHGMAPPTPPATQGQPDELEGLMGSAGRQRGPDMATVEARLAELGNEEPEPAAPGNFEVTAVPPQQTQGEVYDARNPVRDDLEERSRRMYPRQQRDLDAANQAIERGESGLVPTPHNKEWANFYGRNASADPETTQREYEAKKAAERADAGPDAAVTAVPPTRTEGALYRPGQQETVFYDEPEEDLVSALIGPEDEQRVELPRDAFPPGAREGDRFNREDVGEDGRKGNPFAKPVARSPRIDYPGIKATVDEFDEDEAAILPDALEGSVTVRRDSLPPGAREGDTYNTEDLGMGGRKGNPFAEPLPQQEMPQANVQPWPEGRLKLGEPQFDVTAVPPARTEGDVRDARAQGPRWVYEAEGEEPFVIDEGQRQMAMKYERDRRIADLERQFDQSPPGSMGQLLAARELAVARAGLTGQDARQARGFVQQDANREDVQEFQSGQTKAKQEGVMALEDKRQAGRKELKAMGKGRGASGSGLGGLRVKNSDEIRIDIPRDKNGPKPLQVLQRVDMEWRQLALDVKMNDQLKGARRIVQAENNIAARGEDSGLVNAEAFLNFAGATRGGVPVENESKVMWEQRRTWADKIHAFLARAGLAEAAARFLKGGELTPEEAEAAKSVMTTHERKMMAMGIAESKKVLMQQVGESIMPFTSLYAKYGGESGRLMKQHATQLVNSRLQAAGLPADFDPYGLGKARGETTAGSTQPAASTAPKQGMSLKEALGL